MPNYNRWRPQKSNTDKQNKGKDRSLDSIEAKTLFDVPSAICPYCNQPIYDMSAAIEHRETGEPAHFDCVIDRIYKAENLGPKEQLLYMGSGTFAIVEFNEQKRNRFTIKRRIEWETSDERKEWRQKLQKHIN